MIINVHPPIAEQARKNAFLNKLFGPKKINLHDLSAPHVEAFFGVKLQNGRSFHSEEFPALIHVNPHFNSFTLFDSPPAETRRAAAVRIRDFIAAHYQGYEVYVSLEGADVTLTSKGGKVVSAVWKGEEIFKGIFDAVEGAKVRIF